MAASSAVPSSTHLLRLSASRSEHHRLLLLPLLASRPRSPLRASRRFSSYPPDAVVVVPDPRAGGGEDGCGDDDDDDDDDEEDWSLDLLARFLKNVFRKISRRARRAVRTVLPSSISTKLVRFAVNGVLILAFLWILKAFLEVVCAFGSMVFVSILFVRGIWSAISYINWNRYHYSNSRDNDDITWNVVRPAT